MVREKRLPKRQFHVVRAVLERFARWFKAPLSLKEGGSPHLIGSLDGLRGVAVLLVALSHMSHMGMYAFFQGFNFAGIGKFGVYLFFALSAFLLSLPFYRYSRRDLTGYMWANYAFRRFTRIFPLFLLFLLSSVLLTHVGIPLPFDISPQDFWRHLTLQEGEGVLWSIPVEVTYYAVLPLVALIFAAGLRRNLLAAGVVTLLMSLIASSVWDPREAPTNTTHLGFYLPIFFWGSYAALVHHQLQRSQLSTSIKRALELAALVAFAAVMLISPSVLSSLTHLPFKFDRFHDAHLLLGVLWCVIIVAHLHGVGWLRRALCWAPLRLLGTVSFSFYLVHLPMLRIVRKLPLSGTVWSATSGFVALALTLLVSICLYAYIEKPLMGLRLPRRRTNIPSPSHLYWLGNNRRKRL